MVKQLLLSQANVDIENNVSSAIFSISTITLYLMLMLEWNLMGHLISQSVSGWVGVANTVLCQDYDANVNLKCMYCELQLSNSKRIAQYYFYA